MFGENSCAPLPDLEELFAVVANMYDVAEPPRSCTEERLSTESKDWVRGLVFDFERLARVRRQRLRFVVEAPIPLLPRCRRMPTVVVIPGRDSLNVAQSHNSHQEKLTCGDIGVAVRHLW